MARIRTVKPEFWEDEKVASMPHGARLLFIALWNLADDEGRLRGGAALIHRRAFPYEPEAPVGAWIEELEAKGFVRRYVLDGQTYLDIPNFLKHQVIKKASRSKLPPYSPTGSPLVPHHSPTGSPLVPSGTGNREQGTGKGTGSGAAEPQRASENEPWAFVQWFQEQHRTAVGEPYAVVRERDCALAAGLLAEFGIEALKGKAQALFASKDEFKTRNGRTIPALKQWVNALGEKPKLQAPKKRTLLEEIQQDAIARGMAERRFLRVFFDRHRTEPTKAQVEEFLAGRAVEGLTLEAVA